MRQMDLRPVEAAKAEVIRENGVQDVQEVQTDMTIEDPAEIGEIIHLNGMTVALETDTVTGTHQEGAATTARPWIAVDTTVVATTGAATIVAVTTVAVMTAVAMTAELRHVEVQIAMTAADTTAAAMIEAAMTAEGLTAEDLPCAEAAATTGHPWVAAARGRGAQGRGLLLAADHPLLGDPLAVEDRSQDKCFDP
uniref:Uncharacterized protein n=1 Tax=Hanusia phi TaxID=3032 RepID=A0A7S0I0G9_9CRYP|mmetsp:Transcript_7525/g.17092  ORF Transcript_7525/g.17092 Transcript_7525/m.17092 type:complete len:195 (+) Transcript_7525:524-1108(+)